MTDERIREHLIRSGIRNLNEFGYPNVTPENILTDEIYKEMFKSMLKDNLGGGNKQVDVAINQLLSEVSK